MVVHASNALFFFLAGLFPLHCDSHLALTGRAGAPFDGSPFSALTANDSVVAPIVPSLKLLSLSSSSASLSVTPSFYCNCIVRQRGEARGVFLVFDGGAGSASSCLAR